MIGFIRNILAKPFRILKGTYDKPMPADHMNFEHNRELWNRYVKGWKKEEIPIQNPDVKEEERDSYIKCLGDEWGRAADVQNIINEYIVPYVTKESVVAEIGVGGARIASEVAGETRELWCFDISTEMLEVAKAALAGRSNVRFILMEHPSFPPECDEMFDFVYAFDVFVHFDLYMMWKYFKEIRKILKSGGRAFIHTSNLRAPGGWKSFSSQDKYSVVRHYFISPEIIDILAEHSDMNIIKASTIDPSNFYLNRDYLFVLEKR